MPVPARAAHDVIIMNIIKTPNFDILPDQREIASAGPAIGPGCGNPDCIEPLLFNESHVTCPCDSSVLIDSIVGCSVCKPTNPISNVPMNV